ERAAWKFVEEEKPNFTLATINPPVVYGPVIPSLNSIALLNTSNELFWNLITGAVKSQDNLTATRFWVSVYDVAKAHVLAMEKEAAGSNRFLILNGSTSTAEVAKIVADKFPEFKDKLPELTEGDLKGPAFGYNNSKSKEVLGLEYVDLEKTVIDSVNSLRPLLTAVNE
ncbi:methylglyoxal reductase (NADPH-dependent) gre2, partial [Ascosphaera atra]